jgi:4-hydroxy-3-methylbut-2-enyl diphosphate reductase IspH
MPANWNRYCEQLRDVDDSLYQQKEKFKMGLLTSTTKIKPEVQEIADKLEDEISSSSEV